MAKRRTIAYLAVLVFSLCLSSCVSIEEFIKFRREGGGSYMMELDAITIGTSLYFTSKGAPGKQLIDLFDKYTGGVNELNSALNEIEGISQVEANIDTVKFGYTLSFNFDRISALNKALLKIYPDNVAKNNRQKYFKKKGQCLIRSKEDYLTALISKKEFIPDRMDMKGMLVRDVFVASNLELEGDIESVDNRAYLPKGKGLTWKKYVNSKRDASLQIGVTIDLRNMKLR